MKTQVGNYRNAKGQEFERLGDNLSCCQCGFTWAADHQLEDEDEYCPLCCIEELQRRVDELEAS